MEYLGRYKVVRRVGQGGFGEVFEAFDPALRRRVALKTCRSRDREVLQRFEQEAALAAALHHRNLTATYDFSLETNPAYLVQEFLEGEDLNQKIARREDLSFAIRLSYLIQLARGLGHAHSKRVLHRDVKPANVRVLPEGVIKLMDFGIAKSFDDLAPLTLAGETMGTAAYLSPEQIRGQGLDPRSDIYSFGITAYELLSYQRAFPGENSDEVLRSVLETRPRALQDLLPECPKTMVRLVDRCCSADPDARFSTFEQVLDQFDHILGEDSSGRRTADPERTIVSVQPKRPGNLIEPKLVTTPPISSKPDRRLGSERRTVAATRGQSGPPRTRGRASATPSPMPAGPGGILRLVAALVLMALLGAAAAAWFFGRSPARLSARNPLDAASPASTLPTELPGEVLVASSINERVDTSSDTELASADLPPFEPMDTAAATAATLELAPAWNPRLTARVAGRSVVLDRTRTVTIPSGVPSTVIFNLTDDPATSWDESQTERTSVTLAPGERKTLATALRQPGTLTIRAALGTPQFHVRIDGKPAGWAPISEHVLAPGPHRVSISTSPLVNQGAPVVHTVAVDSGVEKIMTVDIGSTSTPRVVSKPWITAP